MKWKSAKIINNYTSDMEQEAERIDRTVQQAAQYALKRCSIPFHMRSWSPKVIQAGLLIKFWRVHLSALRTSKDYSEIIERVKTKLHAVPESYEELTVPQVQKQLRNAHKVAKALRKDADSIRDTFMQELSEYRAKQGNKDVGLVVQQIKRTEKLRNGYKTLKPKLTPDKIQKGGLSYV